MWKYIKMLDFWVTVGGVELKHEGVKCGNKECTKTNIGMKKKFWLIDWIVNAGVHNLHNNLTSTDSDHWDSGPWKWFGVAQL